jgi:hypothetical protein
MRSCEEAHGTNVECAIGCCLRPCFMPVTNRMISAKFVEWSGKFNYSWKDHIYIYIVCTSYEVRITCVDNLKNCFLRKQYT